MLTFESASVLGVNSIVEKLSVSVAPVVRGYKNIIANEHDSTVSPLREGQAPGVYP